MVFKVSKLEQFTETVNTSTRRDKTEWKLLLRNRNLQLFSIIKIFECLYFASLAYLPFLANQIGLRVSKYTFLLGISLLITFVFAVIAGYIADKKEKKFFYVFDIAYDAIPAIIFGVTRDVTLFYVAFLLMSVKDILSPVSFAYKYECFSDEDVKIVIPILSSVSSLVYVIAPLIVSVLWIRYNTSVFIIGGICSIIAAVIALIYLPRTAGVDLN